MPSILIVDPDPQARNALALLLQRKLGIDEIYQAGDWNALTRQLHIGCLDLLLLDRSFLGDAVFESSAQLDRLCPKLRLVLLSLDEQDAALARQLGAAFIYKGSPPDVVLAALKLLI